MTKRNSCNKREEQPEKRRKKRSRETKVDEKKKGIKRQEGDWKRLREERVN